AQTNSPASQWAVFLGYFCMGLMVFTAFLMNLYPVRYIHIGRFMDRNPWFTWTNLVLMVVFVFTPYFGYLVFCQMVLYLLSPLITWRVDPDAAAREARKDG
ncbi:MAG: CDP-alcohol phosphatidyltransferase, partial [Desulfosalsimonas sp.]